MFYPEIDAGVTVTQQKLITAAGLDLNRLRQERNQFVRLRRRNALLHSGTCPAVRDKPDGQVEHLSLSILETSGYRPHRACIGSVPGLFRGSYALAGHMVAVGELEREVRAVETATVPAPARCAALLGELTDEYLDQAVDAVDGSRDRLRQARARIEKAAASWAVAPNTLRLRPFVVGLLHLPPASTKLLRLSPAIADRIATAGWSAWQHAVADELSPAESGEAARAAFVECVTALRQFGVELPDPSADDMAALIATWEATLDEACAAADHEEVLVAAGALALVNVDVQQVLATFPTVRPRVDTAVVRCPAVVADWLSDRRAGSPTMTSVVVHLGPLAPGVDATAVMECFTGLWEPSGSGPLADAQAALRHAYVLCQPGT
jgi:hypothetical protein